MTRARVLVAEDKGSLLRLLERLLSDRHDVTTAADGAEAVALVSSQRFDVVLTDVRMPGADGFQVLRAAKEAAPDTEVVVMTAFATIGDAVEAMKRGAFDYLQKPFEPDDVSLVVARALERRRSRGSTEPPTNPVESLAGEGDPVESSPDDLLRLPFRDAVNLARDRVSRDYLVALLRQHGGNVTRAAERAGMERESLHRLLKRYRVRSEDFKRTDGT